MTRVLVADHDASRCEARAARARALGYEVQCAFSTPELEHALKTPQGVLLIISNFAGKSVLPILQRLKRDAPDMRALVIGLGAGSEEVSSVLAAGAADLIDHEPRADEIRSAVDGAFRETEGFDGMFRGLALSDILQMLHFSRKSATVRVGRNARVLVRGGEIFHAEVGDIEGRAAIRALLAQRSGSVVMLPLQEHETTISQTFDALLIDIMRELDEAAREGDGPSVDLWPPVAASIPPPPMEPRSDTPVDLEADQDAVRTYEDAPVADTGPPATIPETEPETPSDSERDDSDLDYGEDTVWDDQTAPPLKASGELGADFVASGDIEALDGSLSSDDSWDKTDAAPIPVFRAPMDDPEAKTVADEVEVETEQPEIGDVITDEAEVPAAALAPPLGLDDRGPAFDPADSFFDDGADTNIPPLRLSQVPPPTDAPGPSEDTDIPSRAPAKNPVVWIAAAVIVLALAAVAFSSGQKKEPSENVKKEAAPVATSTGSSGLSPD